MIEAFILMTAADKFIYLYAETSLLFNDFSIGQLDERIKKERLKDLVAGIEQTYYCILGLGVR